MSDFDYFTDKTDESTENESSDGARDESVGEDYGNFGTDEPAGDSVSADSFSGVSFYEPKGEPHERYDEIFDSTKPKTVGFSVASMVLGILSVVCCCFGWTGLIFGILAIVFSAVSRKVLGYFDGMSIAGLIVGIFGVCFGVLIIFFTYGPLSEAIKEIIAEIEAGAELDAQSATPSLFKTLYSFILNI